MSPGELDNLVWKDVLCRKCQVPLQGKRLLFASEILGQKWGRATDSSAGHFDCSSYPLFLSKRILSLRPTEEEPICRIHSTESYAQHQKGQLCSGKYRWCQSPCHVNNLVSLKRSKRATVAEKLCLPCSLATVRGFLVQELSLDLAWPHTAGRHFKNKEAIVPRRMHTVPACLSISPTQVGFSACGSTKSFSTNVKGLCVLIDAQERMWLR